MRKRYTDGQLLEWAAKLYLATFKAALQDVDVSYPELISLLRRNSVDADLIRNFRRTAMVMAPKILDENRPVPYTVERLMHDMVAQMAHMPLSEILEVMQTAARAMFQEKFGEDND